MLNGRNEQSREIFSGFFISFSSVKQRQVQIPSCKNYPGFKIGELHEIPWLNFIFVPHS
jgi:hypothetical protein